MARTVGVAVVAVDLAVLGAALLSSGPAGSVRMAHLGPDPWAMAVAMVAELSIGAMLTHGVDTLMLRIRGRG